MRDELTANQGAPTNRLSAVRSTAEAVAALDCYGDKRIMGYRQLARIVFAGSLGGSLVGLLTGAYAASLSIDYVIRRTD